VKLTAHEAMHIEQFRNGLACSEISCERFAVAKLEEFRALRDRPQRRGTPVQLAWALDA
jgi:hypothetical protein